MTNQSQAKQIATDLGITEIGADTAHEHGLVGRIDRTRLANASAALQAHGYEVSDSRDDQGQTWIWWTPRTSTTSEEDRADDSEDETECAYCGRDVTPGSSVPDLSDDAAWAELAPTHASNCEWIQTRAHRRSTEVEAIECECGTWSGERCQWSGPKSETVVVEWMPEQHRASH
jgi:hypothetical protein